MPEILGQYVDRLVTIEMRNRAMPIGITVPLYEAALAEAGGRPLTLQAAEGLVANVHKGDNVFIITGAGTPPTLVNGESDGPPGAAALARSTLLRYWRYPIFIAEEHHVGPIIASSKRRAYLFATMR